MSCRLLFDDNIKVNRLLFDKSLFSFQVKSLMQSKEELERCIKEQEVSKDVSLPKTDDLVDEVALHLIHIRLILRCWGKSSMVCQQKSDAL